METKTFVPKQYAKAKDFKPMLKGTNNKTTVLIPKEKLFEFLGIDRSI